VIKAMATVADQGFDGAQGQLTFDDTDARVPGVLVRWDGAKEVPVENSGS
jgi:branched-chain amino acid transport system substrate-binding protein